MQYHVGSPVEGEDFFNRKKEINAIWRALDSDSLLLLAPRRAGKTSLMKHLVYLAPDKGYQPSYLTVEGAADEADFMERLYRAVAENHPNIMKTLVDRVADSPLGTWVKRVKKVGALGVSIELTAEAKKHWPESMTVFGELLSGLEIPWLLAVDELPLFILKLLRLDDSGKRAVSFLHNLRELRQNQPGVRWLLAGSIGLDTVTGRYNMADTINDLRLTTLGPFSVHSADDFLQALARSYGLDLHQDVRSHILSRLQWLLPYYIQLVFSELLDIDDRPIRVTDIDALFEALLQPANKNYFDYWRQRLRESLGTPDDTFATTLLNIACQEPRGTRQAVLRGALGKQIRDPEQRDQRLRYLLDVLVNDGYLVENGERYQFHFPLLREYWKRRVAP
ncbi:hypothetical protein [Thiolapillus sp.]|uniref:hypothetical protein n=1 Tax=Thiolapillus sp. TaxID=2017437 RepID=UPI00263AFD50|nr:hypothetical protein [Thiolapillus sp.]